MDEEPPYGHVEAIAPRIRRVLARNPSVFTGTGTATFIVGAGSDLAVIDPGPDDSAHLAALLEAIGSARVSAILVTHTHRDHSPLSRPLAAATGAPILGCAPLAPAGPGAGAEEGFDPDYAPTATLADGDTVAGPDWTLAAVHTPGHTSNHLCFAFPQESALFSGDHVMGWSTTVVVPPDGSMRAYMDSLTRLQAREDAIYHPTHGPAIARPHSHVRGLLLHRRQREAQVVAALGHGPAAVPDMVAKLYAHIDRRLWPAAAMSVRAHLIDLAERGRAREVEPDRWALA